MGVTFLQLGLVGRWTQKQPYETKDGENKQKKGKSWEPGTSHALLSVRTQRVAKTEGSAEGWATLTFRLTFCTKSDDAISSGR